MLICRLVYLLNGKIIQCGYIEITVDICGSGSVRINDRVNGIYRKLISIEMKKDIYVSAIVSFIVFIAVNTEAKELVFAVHEIRLIIVRVISAKLELSNGDNSVLGFLIDLYFEVFSTAFRIILPAPA